VPQPENHVAAILIEGERFFGALDPRRATGLALGY